MKKQQPAPNLGRPLDRNHLLDMLQPNGKRLRDCTGTECGAIGEFYLALSRIKELAELQ